MSKGQAAQSGTVAFVAEPIVDDQAATAAIEAEGTADLHDATSVEAPKDLRGPHGVSRWIRRSPAKTGIVLLAICAIASVTLATWMYVVQHRSDQQTDPAAQTAALTAATEGSVALLSYSPDSIDRDLTAAKSHLTGEFLTYYSHFTDEIVKPASQKKSIKTTASVARAAVSEMHSDSAVVLLFINQTSMSSDRSEPSQLASTVLVTLTKLNGNWLIAKFEPV
jgi:Mce-associated membrane protein